MNKIPIVLVVFCILFVGLLNVFGAPLNQDTPGVNDPPEITLPAPPSTFMGLPVAIGGVSISDADVGAGTLELDVYIVDMDGLGGLSVSAGDYGTFSWGYGSGQTDQTQIGTLAELNTALSTLTLSPHPLFNGVIRLAFNVDDLGNTGTGGSQGDTDFIDVVVATVSATPSSTPTSTLGVPGTNTPTRTPTNTPVLFTNTPTGIPPTNTPVLTSTGTVTNTPALTSTSTATNTPVFTATGTLTTATNTPLATSVTSTATPTPNPACLYPIPLTAVQGRMLVSTLAFYDATLNSTTNVIIPGGSSWWITDARNGFYKIWIACYAEPVWVLASNMSPNFDEVWNGAALPDAGE